MTKDELIARLKDIEWEDFEVKEAQNPGKFMFPLSELRKQIHSMPRNPSLSKLFRFARLSENAGYGIDKILQLHAPN